MTNSPDGSPPERKTLQTFVLHVCFLTILFWSLPSLDSAYAYGFKFAGNTVFGELGPHLRVDYDWVPPGERNSPGEIAMNGRVIGIERLAWESTYSVRDRGYEPSAALIALMLATPMSRRRRILGSLGAVIALNAFILAQTGLLAVTSFAAANAGLVLGGEWLGGGVRVAEAFFRQPIPRYAAVFAIWALIAAPARAIDMNLGALGEALRRFFAGAAKNSKAAKSAKPSTDEDANN
jgi:hypothetical protein